MKIEIRCSACGRGYLVEPGRSPSRLICPECTHPIEIGAEMPVPSTPRALRDAPPTEPAAQEPRPTDAGQEVVCPRCDLHFNPWRSTPAAKPSSKRLTVLVVEDMPYFREVAEDALRADYEVITAGTVAEARAALARGGIDALILDPSLDGGGYGIDLLQEMSVKPFPVLVYTEQDESDMYGDSWNELRRLGADDILIKGMNVGEALLRKIDTLLGRDLEEDDELVANTSVSKRRSPA